MSEQCGKRLTEGLRSMGLPLALTRLRETVRNRLGSEDMRESWENLRTGTLAKKEEVVLAALPEPASQDPLLGHLSEQIRLQVKNRLIQALERIYNPPPPDCAREFLFGHVKGEARGKATQMLGQLAQPRHDLKAVAQEFRAATEASDEAKLRWERAQGLNTPELESLRARLDEIKTETGNINRRIGDLENECRTRESQLKNLTAEIGQMTAQLGKLEPEQRRLDLAERAGLVMADLVESLEGSIGARLEQAVTRQFLKIADARFHGGGIRLSRERDPVVSFPDGRPDFTLGTASGFESRSFGVAFTLALADITRRRLPLVIDTPLGNADSQYRPRMLKALTDFDLDQVIILTHDQEVTPDLVRLIEPYTTQKLLVEFDHEKGQSLIHRDRFFGDRT